MGQRANCVLVELQFRVCNNEPRTSFEFQITLYWFHLFLKFFVRVLEVICIGVTWLVASEGAKSALGIRVPLLCVPYNAGFLNLLSLYTTQMIILKMFLFFYLPFVNSVAKNHFFCLHHPKNNFEKFVFLFCPLKLATPKLFFLFTPPKKIISKIFVFLFSPLKRVSPKLFFFLFTPPKK